MLELASSDPELAESDLFGIEVAQHLYAECVHKKSQGAFANPNTFFFQRNILAGKVFPDRSINTSLSFALTHEIVSYAGGLAALRQFATTVFEQTAPGGVWINSDVCGPEQGGRMVLLRFREPGLSRSPRELEGLDAGEAKAYVDALPPAARLIQFAQDFSRYSSAPFELEVIDDATARLRLSDAMEFMSKFRYTENWLSECHERFCELDWTAWKELAESIGWTVDPRSGVWRNQWMVENVFDPAAELADLDGKVISWPATHVMLVAARRS
jgi:hypothetical protein